MSSILSVADNDEAKISSCFESIAAYALLLSHHMPLSALTKYVISLFTIISAIAPPVPQLRLLTELWSLLLEQWRSLPDIFPSTLLSLSASSFTPLFKATYMLVLFRTLAFATDSIASDKDKYTKSDFILMVIKVVRPYIRWCIF